MTADVRCARNAAAPSVVSRGARASGSIRAGAAPSSFGVLILGWGAANQPAFGGTMVPTLDLTMLVPIDAGGRWSLGFPWPAGFAPGSSMWWQLAVVDNTTPFGLAATDGLRSRTP